MVRNIFLSRLSKGEILIADGATGSNLLARGLPPGVTSEHWVMEQPEQILQIHRDFINAGADIILTSTFGATSIRLAGTTLAERTSEVNIKAATLARQAVTGTPCLVGGSLGPVGQLIKPYGPLETSQVTDAYAEQARALAQAGVDLLVIETQFDLTEARAAIQGVRSVTTLPLVCSFSYDRGLRTMMGVKPSQAGRELEAMGVDVVGINCGRSLEENLLNLQELRQATNKPIWFKPNAGLPQVDSQGKSYYSLIPEEMGQATIKWLSAGAQIVGGCCGTSPAHLEQIALNIKRLSH